MSVLIKSGESYTFNIKTQDQTGTKPPVEVVLPSPKVDPYPPLNSYPGGIQYDELQFTPGGTQYRIYTKNYNSEKLLAVKFVPPAGKKKLTIVWIFSYVPGSMYQSISEVVGDFSNKAVLTSGEKRVVQGAHIDLSTVPGTDLPTVVPGRTYYLNLRSVPTEPRDIQLMLSTFSE